MEEERAKTQAVIMGLEATFTGGCRTGVGKGDRVIADGRL